MSIFDTDFEGLQDVIFDDYKPKTPHVSRLKDHLVFFRQGGVSKEWQMEFVNEFMKLSPEKMLTKSATSIAFEVNHKRRRLKRKQQMKWFRSLK